MREWDGFLAEDNYGVEESSASFAAETEVEVHEVDVVEVSEVSFESYLSVTETFSAAASHESEAALGHTAAGGDHASDDSGLTHGHEYGHDSGHDGDSAFDGLDLF
ncbi:hypothetical protein ACPC54_01465 [Kitasatospora sp. NPDC094028]